MPISHLYSINDQNAVFFFFLIYNFDLLEFSGLILSLRMILIFLLLPYLFFHILIVGISKQVTILLVLLVQEQPDCAWDELLGINRSYSNHNL